MRFVIFPEPTAFSIPGDRSTGPWGLSEFILQSLLTMPENFTSAETSLNVASISKKLAGLAGIKQSGVKVYFTDSEYEFIVKRWHIAIQIFCGPPKVLPHHLAPCFAVYSHALHSAGVGEPPPKDVP